MINVCIVDAIHIVNFQYKWEHCIFRRTTIKVIITIKMEDLYKQLSLTFI